MKSILKKAYCIFCFFAITSTPLLAIENGIYAIKLSNNKAIDADKDKFQINGNDVVVWDYWKGNNQLWKVENIGGNKHKITCLAGGKALSAWNDQVNNNGCRVTLWDYWGGESQHWIIENVGNESYSLKCEASNAKKVMDADPNKMNTNGSKMVLWDYWGGESQKWRFEKVTDYLASSVGRSNNQNSPSYGSSTRSEENSMSCTSRRVEFTESNFERIITGGIWDKIYPGVIYSANSVTDGSYTTLNMPRNPMTIAVNLIAAPSGGLAKTLPGNTINRSTVWQEISNLLRQNSGVINASRAVFEMKQIHSAEQLKVFVGGDFSGWGASVQATFKSSSSNSRNVYIVKLTQVYFDVVVDDNQQLATTPPSDDNALYVHSVSYGKIGYLRIESTESEQTIAASLNARYNWGTGNAGIQANVDYHKVLRESSTVGFTLGGAPIVVSSADQFDQYVKDARWNPSVQVYPVAYKLKFLRDRSDAYVSMTTSYTERICEPIRRGRVLRVLTQTGSDDLRNYNTAYVTVNYHNGTSSKEYPLLRGQGQNVGVTKEITLDEEIDLVNVRSISIRHDGTPNNDVLHGGDAFHTYDNWDLIALRITLLTTNRQQVNIYNSQLNSVEKDKVPIKFTGDKRIAEFLRQL